MTNQRTYTNLEKRFKILYLLALHVDIGVFIDKMHELEKRILSEHPQAESELSKLEDRMIGLMEESEESQFDSINAN